MKHKLMEMASMGEVSIVGVDLAKNVFPLQGASADGSVVFRKKLSWSAPIEWSDLNGQLIDMIRVGHTSNLLRAPSSLLEIWTRSAHYHPGQ